MFLPVTGDDCVSVFMNSGQTEDERRSRQSYSGRYTLTLWTCRAAFCPCVCVRHSTNIHLETDRLLFCSDGEHSKWMRCTRWYSRRTGWDEETGGNLCEEEREIREEEGPLTTHHPQELQLCRCWKHESETQNTHEVYLCHRVALM